MKIHVQKIEILSRLLKESHITKKEALLLLNNEEEQEGDETIEEFKQNIKAAQYTSAYFNMPLVFTNSNYTSTNTIDYPNKNINTK